MSAKKLPTQSNMLLASFNMGDKETFQLFPISKDCPYLEIVYMPEEKTLCIVNISKKLKYNFVPKLDESGDMIPVKGKAHRTFKEQREKIDIHHEHYLTKKEEIIEFVQMFAINADTFDFQKFIVS